MGLQENKARQGFRKTNFSYPQISTYTCAYQGAKNVFQKSDNLCFLVTTVLLFAPFTL